MFGLDTPQNSLIHLDTWLVLLGAVTPFVTALLTKWRTSDVVKGIVSAGVTALAAFVKKGLDAGDLTWASFLNGWIQIVVAHAVMWLMFLSDATAKVNQATGTFGVGTATPVDVEPVKPTPPPVDGVATQGE